MSDRDFRLSKNVCPTRYDLTIDVDLDAWRFRGREAIDVVIDQPTAKIDLHSVDLEVLEAHVDGVGRSAQSPRLSFNPEAETVTLHFADPVPAGTATLRLSFAADVRAGLRGFYRSQKDGLRYAATQFEAADARRAFPCFDEPEFKARFALTLEVPSNVVAIANGAIAEESEIPGGRRRIRFTETPPISSYLVAYTIGPYEATPVATTPSRVPVRVFLPRGMVAKGTFARDAHVQSLSYLEDYTGIAYPYGKVDAIGIPDFEAGAMENPGAITYRLTAIAADAERSSTPALKNIFYTAAHELTHMWWGDLVTMAWWDDLWLNESFATFIGYKVVADLMPEWGMWRDFVATLARPFNLDALVSTHPISFEVKNAKQATERFDVITYWKGAGVVRMIEGFLGADVFRAGVRAYLNRYRERNATADDFWRELTDASGRDVGAIANAWIRLPGHPLVSIETRAGADSLALALRQERFYADPRASESAPAQRWPIPMVVKYGTGDGTVCEERLVLDREQATLQLPGARWFYPNGDGTGFYRFALDDRAVARLVEALQEVLNAQERLDLIGNQWALVKAGTVAAAQFFSLLDGFRNEADRAVLSTITERLAWVDTHVLADAARPHFERFVAAFYAPQLAQLGWDARPTDSADDRIRRATVIGALGQLATLPEVGTEARTRLARYFEDAGSLDPNLASAVVAIAARKGDAELYDRFLERKRSAAGDPEEEQRFLFGLTAFEDENLIGRTLDLTLTDDVRPQDRAHLLARLFGNSRSRAAAWAFVRDRWSEITSGMDPMLQQNIVRGLAQLTPEPIATEVRAFLPDHASDETRETIAQALEQLTIDVAACLRLAPEVSSALNRESKAESRK
jgi:puromycin-sensitive aminopeptidase